MSDISHTPRRVLLAAAAFAAVGGAHSAFAQPASGDPHELVAIMERYAQALRTNNVEALVAMYTDDGVFMREDLPAAVGRAALQAAYREVFATLKIDLRFDIHETEVAGDMAWLRSTSKGLIKILASGREAKGSFNSLTVFKRQAGAWKIRCSIYASNKPLPGVVPQ